MIELPLIHFLIYSYPSAKCGEFQQCSEELCKDGLVKKKGDFVFSLQVAADSETSTVQIVGLTASLSYKVEEKDIRKSIEQLMHELNMSVIGTASEDELSAAGYHANNAVAEKQVVEDDAVEIDLDTIEGSDQRSFAAQNRDRLVPNSERKPHLLLLRKRALAREELCVRGVQKVKPKPKVRPGRNRRWRVGGQLVMPRSVALGWAVS